MGEGSTATVGTVVNALNDGFGTMATDAMNGIATILPTVLPILAAIIVIGIIIKIVRRITGRG